MGINRILKGSGGGDQAEDDSLFSEDLVEVVLAISEGEIKGLKDDSLKNLYFSGTPHTSTTGELNFSDSEFTLDYVTGTADPEPIDYVLGGSSGVFTVNHKLVKDVPKLVALPNSTNQQFSHLEVRINIDSLVRYKDEGGFETSVEFKIEWQHATGAESPWHDLDPSKPVHKVTGKTVSGFSKEYKGKISDTPITLGESGVYNVKVTKLTKDSDENLRTDIVFSAINLVLSSKLAEPEVHPHLAMAHFYGRLGDQLTSAPTITAVWQGILCSIPSNYNPETRSYDEGTIWDGQFKGEKAYTNNPFWLIRELALNPRFGLAATLKYLSVNDYELYELAKHADELVPADQEGGLQPRYTFNGVLDKPMDGMELLNYVAGSCFARVFDDSQGQLRIVADRNDPSVMLISAESGIVQAETVFSYSKTDVRKRANVMYATYVEPSMDWTPQQLKVTHTEAEERFGTVQVTQQLVGCTDRHEGFRKLKHMISTAQTEVITVTFSLPLTGILLEPYQIVDIADPDMGWSLSGRVWTLTGTILQFRDPIIFDSVGMFTIKFQSSVNGVITRQFNIDELGEYSQVTLDSNISEGLPEHCVFTVESEEGVGFAKPFRIIRVDEVSGSSDTYSITAVEINRNKYGDSDNAVLIDGVIDSPDYSYKSPVTLKPATSIHVTQTRNPRDGYINVTLRWDDPNPAGFNPHYTVSLFRGGLEFLSANSPITSHTFESVEATEFQVQIQTHNSLGTVTSNFINFVPNYLLSPVLGDLWLTDGLALIDGGFISGDLHLDIWLRLKNPDYLGLWLDVDREPTISKIWAKLVKLGGQEIATIEVIDRKVVFPLVDNLEVITDLRVEVYVEDIDGELSSILGSKTFDSDGVVVIKGINHTPTPLGVLASVTLDEPIGDAQIAWCISDNGSEGFTDAKIVGVGEVLNISSLPAEADLFLWARVTDGVVQVYPAGNGIPFTTLGLTIDEPDLVDVEEIKEELKNIPRAWDSMVNDIGLIFGDAIVDKARIDNSKQIEAESENRQQALQTLDWELNGLQNLFPIRETSISDSSISTPKLKANSVQADKIAANSIYAGHVVAGAIVTDKLSANAVIADKIAAGAIIADKLAVDSVLASKIAAGAITTDKLTSYAVTAEKIEALAINAGHIRANTIEAGHIKSKAITAAKLESNLILGNDAKFTGELAVVGSGGKILLDPNSGVCSIETTDIKLKGGGGGSFVIAQSNVGSTAYIFYDSTGYARLYITDKGSVISNPPSGNTMGDFICRGNSTYGVYVENGRGVYAPGGVSPFTGKHIGILNDQSQFVIGDIVSRKRVLAKPDVDNSISELQASSKRKQKNCYGVMSSFITLNDYFSLAKELPLGLTLEQLDVDTQVSLLSRLVSINSVGEGLINVCGLGGNIEDGDNLCASSMGGKAEQQGDDVIYNYTVAESHEDVVFDFPEQVKQIACTYRF